MTPRAYLSHSQRSLWKRSQKAYIEKYVYEKPQYITKEMAFGKKMAIAIEEEKETDDKKLNEIIKQLPKLEKAEMELLVEMKIDNEVIPLYGKMDHATFDLMRIKEYKSGNEKWTQKRVDEDEQISFYATMVWIKTKKIPNDLVLVWVPTMDDPENPNGIIIAGEPIVFKTKRTMAHIINTMADCKRVWREINKACEEILI